MTQPDLRKSSLRPLDVIRVGVSGIGTRKFRTALSMIGITIGIAALVGVLGLSESSKADLISELDALGTNLLTVEAGAALGRGSGTLPEGSAGSAGRIRPVEQVSAISSVDATVRRTSYIDEGITGGITVVATDTNLLDTLNGDVADGAFLNEATAQYPNVVLGAVAAERLGVHEVGPGFNVWLGDQWFTVVGILEPFPLAADLDRAAMVGYGAAANWLGSDGIPSMLQLRTDVSFVDDVIAVLPPTVNPEFPEEVEVSRPSDIIEARAAAESAFTSLFLGLGAVALLVGGIGIANVMIIAVIERRNEIGLRRSLGATRGHIRWQFLMESLVLAIMGGIAGVVVGACVTAGYATYQGWAIVVPPEAILGGFGAAALIGVVAGLYPAMRAANLAPTEALRAA